MGVPYRERGPRTSEAIEVLKALWAGDDVTYEGKYYRFRNVTIDPKPVQKPHPPIWIGGGTQPSEKVYGQTVPNIDPVLKRIAHYADTWVPHSSATPEMVKADWAKVQGFAREYGRDPARIGRVYSNFVWVLKPGERPESAAPHFKVYSGMDLDYWKTYYLLGHRPGGRRSHQRADRGARRRRRQHRPQPARLVARAARAHRRRGAAERSRATAQPRPIRYTGERIRRLEDPRLLRGRGRFLDDLVLPRMLAVAFVRSPHAHARSPRSMRPRPARCRASRPSSPPSISAGTSAPLAPRLVGGGFTADRVGAAGRRRVRFAGEAVAAVVAADAYVAADARELVQVEYEPRAALATAGRRAGRRTRAVPARLASRRRRRRVRRGADRPARAFHARATGRRPRWSRAASSPTGTATRSPCGRPRRPPPFCAPRWRRRSASRRRRIRVVVARRRRRLRPEDARLPRGRRGGGAGPPARPPGEVDRGAARAPHLGLPRARAAHGRRAGGRRRGGCTACARGCSRTPARITSFRSRGRWSRWAARPSCPGRTASRPTSTRPWPWPPTSRRSAPTAASA